MKPDERDLPMTPQEYTVLGHIGRHGVICVSAACKKLHMSQPKLQKIKASLERKGLVTLAGTEPGERNPELVRKYYDLTVPGFCELLVATVGLPVRAADIASGTTILGRNGPSVLPGWTPEVTFAGPVPLPPGNPAEATRNAAMETVGFREFLLQAGHTGWFDADEVGRLIRRHVAVCPLFFANWEEICRQCDTETRLLVLPGVSVVLDGGTECCMLLQAAMRRVLREIRTLSSQMVSKQTVFSAPVSRVPACMEALVTGALLREFFPDPERMYRPYVAILGGFEEISPVLREYLRGMQEDYVRQAERIEEILCEDVGVWTKLGL